MNTDAYHNLLVNGGEGGKDLPSTRTECLDEFEANIISLCQEMGLVYTPTFTREQTIKDLFVKWTGTNKGHGLFITVTGFNPKTLYVDRDGSSRLGEIKDFFVDCDVVDITVSLRSLAHTFANRSRRLIVTIGN